MVKNYMEQLVSDTLKKELTDNRDAYPLICFCPECILEIKATALNILSPFYVTCVAGEVFGEYRSKEIQNLSDVVVAVVKGIEQLIATHPHQKAR